MLAPLHHVAGLVPRRVLALGDGQLLALVADERAVLRADQAAGPQFCPHMGGHDSPLYVGRRYDHFRIAGRQAVGVVAGHLAVALLGVGDLLDEALAVEDVEGFAGPADAEQLDRPAVFGVFLAADGREPGRRDARLVL
jgi:hypothetical protein